MADLKPCPFCGSDNLHMSGDEDGLRYWVECKRCGAEAAYADDAHSCRNAWNTRRVHPTKPEHAQTAVGLPEPCPRVLPQGWIRYTEESVKAYADAKTAEAVGELIAILHRYRTETPLGNQPHMIAEEADRLLTKYAPKKEQDK